MTKLNNLITKRTAGNIQYERDDSSPVKTVQGGVHMGVALVDVTDSTASPMRTMVAGVWKAWKRAGGKLFGLGSYYDENAALLGSTATLTGSSLAANSTFVYVKSGSIVKVCNFSAALIVQFSGFSTEYIVGADETHFFTISGTDAKLRSYNIGDGSLVATSVDTFSSSSIVVDSGSGNMIVAFSGGMKLVLKSSLTIAGNAPAYKTPDGVTVNGRFLCLRDNNLYGSAKGYIIRWYVGTESPSYYAVQSLVVSADVDNNYLWASASESGVDYVVRFSTTLTGRTVLVNTYWINPIAAGKNT